MVKNWKIIARWDFAYLHLICAILQFLHIFEYAQLLDYASYEHEWPLILKLQLSSYIQKWSQSGTVNDLFSAHYLFSAPIQLAPPLRPQKFN